MATLQEILGAISGIADQARGIASNVQAITTPTITTGSPVPAEVEMTSSGDPALSAVPANPMMKWYIGGAVALVVLYIVFKK